MSCKTTRMSARTRSASLAFSVVALISAPVEPVARAAPLAVIEGDAVDVSADHLEVDVERGQARLDGSVVLRIGELEVKCPTVDLKYDRSPRVSWARGTGGVSARLRGVEATATAIEFESDSRTVDLRGAVKLSRGRGWITAEHAVIDIGSGKVTLEDVKGSIPVDPARR